MKGFFFEGKAIEEWLMLLSDGDNKEFASTLNPGVDGVLGVRLPKLRDLAKRIAKSDGWRDFVASAGTRFMEERMLHGMVIGYAKTCDLAERLAMVKAWVPRINSWSVCDSCCTTFKPKKSERDTWWTFIQPYFLAKGEYEIRFGVVMALSLFVDEAHLPRIFEMADCIRHDGYYVKMAVAWLISVCYVKHPNLTLPYLKHNRLDDWTHNKALQKICESLRATAEQKAMIRTLKRK